MACKAVLELLADLDLPAERNLAMIHRQRQRLRGMVGAGPLIWPTSIANRSEHPANHDQLKTGALIRAAVGLGALAGGAGGAAPAAWMTTDAPSVWLFRCRTTFSILRAIEVLGKTQGVDQSLNKPTFPPCWAWTVPPGPRTAQRCHLRTGRLWLDGRTTATTGGVYH